MRHCGRGQQGVGIFPQFSELVVLHNRYVGFLRNDVACLLSQIGDDVPRSTLRTYVTTPTLTLLLSGPILIVNVHWLHVGVYWTQWSCICRAHSSRKSVHRASCFWSKLALLSVYWRLLWLEADKDVRIYKTNSGSTVENIAMH